MGGGDSQDATMLAGAYPRAQNTLPMAPDTPSWLHDIIRSTPYYPVGPKGKQFSPKAVPIIPGSPAGQLYYEPMLNPRDQQLIALQDVIARLGVT